MNIKISTFVSMLHENSEFEKRNASFIKEVEDKLSQKLVFTSLDDYDCDLKLIFIKSGGSEGLFLSSFDKLKAPYYFLTSGENNSLAASLEILTYLNQKGYPAEVIHGDTDYIAKRINELAFICKIKRELSCLRFGVIGKPSDWLISSVPLYQTVFQKTGISLIDIPLNEVESSYSLTFNPEKYSTKYDFSFDKKEISKAECVYDSLVNVVKKYQLDGLTIRCFDLLSSIKTTGCLGLAYLNDKGIVSSCEGDIMALISMKIASLISSGGVFQANPSRIDIKNNEVIFAHCTLPLSMCESFEPMTHFESGIGMAIRGKLKKTRVTVFRMSADLKNYYVSEGEIMDNLEEKNLCRTQIRVKMDDDVKILLTHPCGNHHIIFYGEYKDEIKLLMSSLLGE